MSIEATSPFNFFIIAGVMFGLSGLIYRWLTRWSQLERLYAQNIPLNLISKGSYRWVRCKVGLTSISASIEIYPAGLWVKPGFPLTLFMKPVLVPWNKLTIIKRDKLFFTPRAMLRIAGCPSRFVISGKVDLSLVEGKRN